MQRTGVIKYLHLRMEQHVKTLDPNNPRDYIDVFLIEKLKHQELYPGKENQSHYFTG